MTDLPPEQRQKKKDEIAAMKHGLYMEEAYTLVKLLRQQRLFLKSIQSRLAFKDEDA